MSLYNDSDASFATQTMRNPPRWYKFDDFFNKPLNNIRYLFILYINTLQDRIVYKKLKYFTFNSWISNDKIIPIDMES